MESWESIQKVLSHIEENLSEKVEISNLASVACLSPFYFQKLFHRLVGKPVAEYIKLRRLANAADYLAINNIQIIDVSINFGFDNHETFTRAFKEAYGLTPTNYRNNPRPLSHFIVPDISMKYQLIDENVPLVAYDIILEVAKKNLLNQRFFAGIKIQNNVNDTPGIDYLGELWNRFHKVKSENIGLKDSPAEVGVSSQGEVEGCFTYFAGTEIISDLPQADLVNWTMPQGNYVVCTFESETFNSLTTNALNKAINYMLNIWLPRHNLKTEPFLIELYFNTNQDTTKMEIWFKIILT
jgi:AraC family transcriptional regulator